eukprot:scaffold648502_cov42-Prasinocladus_malaysianus.AAC.1
MPWACSSGFLGGILGGGEASPALPSARTATVTAGLDSPGLSAMAAHYLQRAGAPADNQQHHQLSNSVFSAFSSPVPPGPTDGGWLVSPTRGGGNKAAFADEDFHSLMDEDHVCVVCLDREPGGAILEPCGHAQLCLACADAVHASGH